MAGCEKEDESKATIYRGDDTAAFGGTLMRINVTNNTPYTISKVVWTSGTIRKEFENPSNPIVVNLTSEETMKLSTDNICQVACYDQYGRKMTIPKTLKFKSIQRKV